MLYVNLKPHDRPEAYLRASDMLRRNPPVFHSGSVATQLADLAEKVNEYDKRPTAELLEAIEVSWGVCRLMGLS